MGERRRVTVSRRLIFLPSLLFNQANRLQIQIHRDDKGQDSAAQSIHSSDDDSLVDNVTNEEDDMASNDEDQDTDGLIPDELEDPKSPIDGLQKFDWGSADAELEEFMASGSEDDESDSGSVTSRKQLSIRFMELLLSNRSQGASERSQPSGRGRKHPRDETDDDETDEESSLAKKQRLARVRTTGLKTVKTPNSANSESSLPTPEITGEEELDRDETIPPNAEDDGDVDEDDLEAEMMAEFEKGDWGEEPQDDDEGDDGDEGG